MAAPRNGRKVVSRKMSIWVGHYEPLELFCLWTKVHQFSSAQRGRGSGWQSFCRCSICRLVPEIFAIKVESCQKSRRNLDVFWPSQIFGGGPYKSCTRVITATSRHVVWKSFVRILPLARKLLRLIRWILSLNFKFSGLIFWGGPPSQLKCALGSLD